LIMRVLVDADIMVFRCGFAAEYQQWFLRVGETTHDFRYKKEAMEKLDELLPGKYSRQEGEDYTLWSETQLEPLGHAIQNLNTLMDHCLNTLEATEFDVKMYLSGQGKTFRDELAVTRPYKGNRDRMHRPTHEFDLRNYIIETWDTQVADGEEADDLLGIAQTADPINTIVVTLDKDLDQIPGMKFNFMHDRVYDVSADKADFNFHMQLLTGDSTDNVPGLPGIGPGKALKALHGLSGGLERLREAWRMYQIHSGTEDPWAYMHEQGQLVKIRTYPGQVWSVPESFGFKEEAAWDSQDLSLF